MRNISVRNIVTYYISKVDNKFYDLEKVEKIIYLLILQNS